MNREEITKLAIEAGCGGIDNFDVIERFAALVAAAAKAEENEACAKVCEQSDKDGEGPDCWDWHAKDYAAAIRARKENT